MSSEEWWGEVVRETFRGAGVAEESLEGVFDEVFDHLFHNVFTSQPTWELVPVGINTLRSTNIHFFCWGVQDRGDGRNNNLVLICLFFCPCP